MSNIFIDALEKKNRLRRIILGGLTDEEVSTANKDRHASRRPRHCGLTIHTGVGCPYLCKYCYVYSMGFPKKIRRYPLSPMALLYSILNNPYFIPGAYGTFLALGSVTEPLHPLTINYTLELLGLINHYLGNPTQLSTKASVDRVYARKVRALNPKISILYSFITIDFHDILEPNSPHPMQRLSSLQNFVDSGLHTSLFIRPIIPGITDEENIQILGFGLEYGVDKVVYGGLRINEEIYKELGEALPKRIMDGIRRRIKGDRLGKKQRYIYLKDIKDRLTMEAIELGYKVFFSACSANIDSMGQSCALCDMGPCGDAKSLPSINEDMIIDFFDYLDLTNIIKEIFIVNGVVRIILKDKPKYIRQITEVIKTVSRRKLEVNII